MAKSSENWLVGIVIGLGVFFVLLLLTFYLKGGVDNQGGGFGGQSSGFFKKNDQSKPKGDMTLQQAYLVCKSKVESLKNMEIHSLRFDSQSSRYDSKNGEFIIFLDVDIIRSGEMESEFAKCHISAINHSIVEFRLKGDRAFLFGL